MNALAEMEKLAASGSVCLRVIPERLQKKLSTSKESIFQVPILSLAILSLAKNAPKNLRCEELTRWTLATLARQYPTIRMTGRRMAWSIALRKHCAEAILFLERTRMVEILETPDRQIKATKEGVTFLRKLRNQSEGIGLLARSLDRSANAALQGGLDLL